MFIPRTRTASRLCISLLNEVERTRGTTDRSLRRCQRGGLARLYPLTYSRSMGPEETAALLIDQGANVNARGKNGFTPLFAV